MVFGSLQFLTGCTQHAIAKSHGGGMGDKKLIRTMDSFDDIRKREWGSVVFGGISS